ncbi:hypothetical protein PHYPSEUDO_002635 [Phytophthora pseudosyringae]|uniref:Uncharacterized protein n=1 Tax=Phytophthora pseudosyringae TaxID=221518 RepID=A0A8T1VXR0_9STRA|nr:hypothetical protein PHYPSEUDO_002635 [Phytophthora pseudosyringae]
MARRAVSLVLVLEAARRRRSSEKVVLPALRNPARCRAGGSNQRDADADEAEWDERHRRLRQRRRRELELEPLPLPQLACVYRPAAAFPTHGYRYDETRRHGRDKPFGRRHRRRDCDCDTNGSSDEDSSSCGSSDEDDRAPTSRKPSTMRSQRMRSLAAMSKLQHDAATTIQVPILATPKADLLLGVAREYRFHRRRQTNRNRRNQRRARQAQDFLDVFLLQEVTSLVPVCLLEVLRETCAQEAVTTKRREDLAASLAGGVLASLVNECIRDVFLDVLQAMVKSHLAQQIDLSRAATPTALAVASDILDDWIKELVADLLPEVLVELASEYTARQQREVVWETLLQYELRSVAFDAVELARAPTAAPTIEIATASICRATSATRPRAMIPTSGTDLLSGKIYSRTNSDPQRPTLSLQRQPLIEAAKFEPIISND